MKKIKLNWIFWVILSVAIIGIGSLIFLNSSSDDPTVCKTDSDCVPAACCHPMLCTTKALAPDCSGVFCSQECVPNTLDCGQGSCLCQNGVCIADIKW